MYKKQYGEYAYWCQDVTIWKLASSDTFLFLPYFDANQIMMQSITEQTHDNMECFY